MQAICSMTGVEPISIHALRGVGVHIENHRGRKAGKVALHVLQPQVALFWFRNDFKQVQARLDGRAMAAPLTPGSSLCVVPAGTELQCEFDAGAAIDYTTVLLEPRFAEGVMPLTVKEPRLGFSHDWITQSLANLQHESTDHDPLSGLMAEGWAMQALAHIARLSDSAKPRHGVMRGGLAAWQERRAKEMLMASLDASVSVNDLAMHCGLSVAHFARAFRQSTGVAPHRWLMDRRVERAKELLQVSKSSLSEIALVCGFADQSHFTRAFRQSVGITPGGWKRMREV